MQMFEIVDIINSLRMIMNSNTFFYQTDFDYDVEILQKAAAGSLFLWMSRKSGTYLFNEHDAHIRDTCAYYTWQYYTDTQYYGVKAFAIEVLENEDRRPIGNIYELNYNAHREDVRKNSFNAKSVSVTFKPTHHKDRYTREFEPGEYNNNWRSILDRYGEAECIRHILGIKDANRLNQILADALLRRREKAIPSAVNDYVKDMVRRRFHEYGYTQDDMVFITPDEASMALKHLIPVYILKSDNTSEKAQNTADVNNAVYSGRIFGMSVQEKRVLNYFKAGNTLADLPFSQRELETMTQIIMKSGGF